MDSLNKIKTLIVDDEPLARTLIRNFISTETDFCVLSECSDGFDALKMIQEHKPDLVFLDIQMPKISGLELLELLENPPVIVFTTAYDQFALKAFELSAIDYLLKPFAKDRFLKALEKVRFFLQNKEQYQHKVSELVDNVNSQQNKLERIVVKDGHKINLIPCEQIVYIEAQDDYVMIYTPTSKHLKQQTMKSLEQILDTDFVRVHRSYFVNIKYIQRLENYDKESHKLIMQNNASIPVSRNGYVELKEKLKI